MNPNQFNEHQPGAGDDFEQKVPKGISSTKVVGFTSTGLFVFLVFIIPAYMTVFLLFAFIVFALTVVLGKRDPGRLSSDQPLNSNVIAGGMGNGSGGFLGAVLKVFSIIFIGAGIFTLLAFGSCMLAFA